VEESAAAAESLKNQALMLVESVAVFKLAQQNGRLAQASAHVPTHAPMLSHHVARPLVSEHSKKTARLPGNAKSGTGKATAANHPSTQPHHEAAPPSADSWETF
jgi:hypothetical protein